jgi:hypothetical protein
MKATDKPQAINVLRSAKPADIEFASIDGLNVASTKSSIARIEAFIRSRKTDYVLIAVRLR